MPTYCYVCDACGHRSDELRPMAAAAAPGPPCCGTPMRRDFSSERTRGHCVAPFESCAMGVPECVIEKAYHVRRADGWDSFVRDPQGHARRLNPVGVSLNKRTGDVIVRNRAERRRSVRELGMVDYGA